MDNKLVLLKSEFNNIITIRNTVKSVFDVLQVRINRLKVFYSDLIKNSKAQMFVFGLDSFNFQGKLIDIEYDDMKRLFIAINNRMYCEYFKLNKIIIEYILKSVEDKKVIDIVKVDNYPIYKDLEPFKDYEFEITHDIHQNILNLLGILLSVLNTKETELSAHRAKQNIGLNINNFTTTFAFNNTVLREKILMFISYIEFFHSLHTKYLKRFSNKIQLMHTHIDTDIKFDESTEINKETKKELLEELNTGKIDKTLLQDLRKSISVNPVHQTEESSESESSEEDLSVESRVGHLEHFSHTSDTAFEKLFRPVTEEHAFHLRNNNMVPKLNTTTQVVSFTHAQGSNTPVENIEITKTEIKTTEIKTTEITTMFSNIDAFCDNIIGCDSPHIHEHFETIAAHEPICDAPEFVVEEPHPIVEEVQPIVEEVQPIVEEVQPIVEEVQPIVEEVQPIAAIVSPTEVEEEEKSLPEEDERSLQEEEEKSLPEEEVKMPQEDDSKTKKKKPRKKKA
jgi:hypothetical protein